jgi:alpha-glucosidase
MPAAPPLEQVQDPAEKNVPGVGPGRDPEPTPMPWERGPNAGFTTGTPWLPLADDFDQLDRDGEAVTGRTALRLGAGLVVELV